MGRKKVHCHQDFTGKILEPWDIVVHVYEVDKKIRMDWALVTEATKTGVTLLKPAGLDVGRVSRVDRLVYVDRFSVPQAIENALTKKHEEFYGTDNEENDTSEENDD